MSDSESDAVFARGAALLARLSPEGAPPPWESFADVAPVLGRSVGTAFGLIVDRPGLDLRTREIVTVSVLATLGGCEPQVAFHVGAALRAGATAAEVVEALTQVSVYAGVPRALNAVAAARGAFTAGGVSGTDPAPRAVVVELLETAAQGGNASALGPVGAAVASGAITADGPLPAGETVYVPLRAAGDLVAVVAVTVQGGSWSTSSSGATCRRQACQADRADTPRRRAPAGSGARRRR